MPPRANWKSNHVGPAIPTMFGLPGFVGDKFFVLTLDVGKIWMKCVRKVHECVRISIQCDVPCIRGVIDDVVRVSRKRFVIDRRCTGFCLSDCLCDWTIFEPLKCNSSSDSFATHRNYSLNCYTFNAERAHLCCVQSMAQHFKPT